jgi:hypothetical protein
LIAKGSFPAIQGQGLPAFRESLERIVPFLAGRTAEIDAWDRVKLLTIQVNHLERWSSPGLLMYRRRGPRDVAGGRHRHQHRFAGRGRHRESCLPEPLRVGELTRYDLEHVQHYRESAVRNTQRVQLFAHRILNRVLRNPRPMAPPMLLRIAAGLPGFQQLAGRFVGMGLQPEHIAT